MVLDSGVGEMELIAVPVRAALLTDGSTPGGEFALAHSDCGLSRGLELDEQVMLVDPDGEFHLATLVDFEFTLEDTTYVLELGVRLPPEAARARLAGSDGQDGTATVLDLLARLRDDPELL